MIDAEISSSEHWLLISAQVNIGSKRIDLKICFVSEIPELKSLLNQRVMLRSELCEVEEKLHLAVRQIEALKI